MSDFVRVLHRFYPQAWPQRPIMVDYEHLDALMAAANRHFSTNPERELGGPELPSLEPR